VTISNDLLNAVLQVHHAVVRATVILRNGGDHSYTGVTTVTAHFVSRFQNSSVYASVWRLVLSSMLVHVEVWCNNGCRDLFRLCIEYGFWK